jgi:hypothetical protein
MLIVSNRRPEVKVKALALVPARVDNSSIILGLCLLVLVLLLITGST